jgi:hypothetical protein
MPDAFRQLAPGTVVHGRAAIPVTKTSGFPGDLGDPAVGRVLLHQAVRLPLGTWSQWTTGLTQLRVGRFSQEEVDIAEETVLTLSEGVFFVKGTFEN